jgi:cell division protein FtsW (lipid II flippase)
LGNTVLLTLYFLLAYFVIKRLPYVKDKYYQYLAVGILALILWQAFVNI